MRSRAELRVVPTNSNLRLKLQIYELIFFIRGCIKKIKKETVETNSKVLNLGSQVSSQWNPLWKGPWLKATQSLYEMELTKDIEETYKIILIFSFRT
jgi:hypothetical protein